MLVHECAVLIWACRLLISNFVMNLRLVTCSCSMNALCVTSGNECAQLDILNDEHKVQYGQGSTQEQEVALGVDLVKLVEVGVKGVMVDCWWGRVEAERQGKYEWKGYKRLFKIVSDTGLDLHVSSLPKAVRQTLAPMNCVIFRGFWSSPCVMGNEEWWGLLPTFSLGILCF